MKNKKNDDDNNKIENLEDIIKKKKLGKFYTENYEYIFQGFDLTNYKDCSFIEPFVGKGHLINFLTKHFNSSSNESLKNLKTEFYDLENNFPNVIIQDTLLKPPVYKDKFVITNPPFLARNKNDKKDIYDMYGNDDLFKCFIKSMIYGEAFGGLIIVPINFLSSIRKNDIILRKMFLERYKVLRINLFEEKVFEDTDYNVVAILFEKRKENDTDFNLPIHIFPEDVFKSFEVSENTHWMIGGELYHLPHNNQYQIFRVYERENALNSEVKNKEDNTQDKEKIVITEPNTRIFLHALDDGFQKRIRLEYVDEERPLFVGKESDRSFASFYILPMITEEKQKEIVERFNNFLEENRSKYNSLFLTNYRESKHTARKRISFQLVYTILQHLL